MTLPNAPALPELFTIMLTKDQLGLLVRLIDEAEIKGRAAALVYSIQRALADAQPAQTESKPDTE